MTTRCSVSVRSAIAWAAQSVSSEVSALSEAEDSAEEVETELSEAELSLLELPESPLLQAEKRAAVLIAAKRAAKTRFFIGLAFFHYSI